MSHVGECGSRVAEAFRQQGRHSLGRQVAPESCRNSTPGIATRHKALSLFNAWAWPFFSRTPPSSPIPFKDHTSLPCSLSNSDSLILPPGTLARAVAMACSFVLFGRELEVPAGV